MNKVNQTNRAPLHLLREQMPSMRECLLKMPFSQSNTPSKTRPPFLHSSPNGLFSDIGNNLINSDKNPSIPEMLRCPPTRGPQPDTLTLSGHRLSRHPSSKRHGFREAQDGFSYKRKRIPHNKGHVDQACRQAFENDSQRGPDADSLIDPRNKESLATRDVNVTSQGTYLNTQIFTEEKNDEFPDYKKLYVTLRGVDQRRSYRADFKVDHAEYRDLHCAIEKVSKRFSQLEEHLKQEDKKSFRCKEIKKQIIREYRDSKCGLIENKRRFQYLHFKLSHIKGLISEYDQDLRNYLY